MKRVIMMFFLFSMIIFAVPFVSAGQTEIIINGSTTVLPVIQQAGESFMIENPDISLAISGGGSGNGIKALNEGLCDMAMSSRDARPSEIEHGRARGVNLVKIPVAVDALVPVVHPDNPVRNLSLEQLRDIYAGKITRWSAVGGRDENIVIISRDSSSGTYEIWAQSVMGKARVTPSALLQASSGVIAQTVSRNRRALGYIGFGYINDTLKKLNVDDIEPTAEAALTQKWPIARELYVFTDGAPEGAVKRLIDFMLDPQKGQKVVAEIGFIPLHQ
jgi:phosphate transport system substrate-binding protein